MSLPGKRLPPPQRAEIAAGAGGAVDTTDGV
jgi:hypothetical protein